MYIELNNDQKDSKLVFKNISTGALWKLKNKPANGNCCK